MPAENPDQILEERHDDGWQKLAQDAAEHWKLDHPGVAALYENHVVPQLHSKGLGHLAIDPEDKAGGRFLHKYGGVDQRESDQVIGYLRSNGESIADKAGDRTAAYLKFMADTVHDGILTGDPESVQRQIDAHVIKAQDVPESYFALQRRIARERGHGNIEITQDLKRQLIEAAQADQRGSLGKWVEYLGGNDGSYPHWFKRYTWDSVLKLGAYDKEKSKFGRRDNSTVAPYPELNREALAYVYDTVKKFHVLDKKVDDVKLTQILKEGSFGRLYAHAVIEVTPDSPELRNDTRGSWTLFGQTDDPRTARRLSSSLQGHGTTWCTAGESTAQTQLQGGDFYVYYTRDEDGRDTVPRVAIRMESGEVAEVRGVGKDQELEPVMIDIATEKFTQLPGGEAYIRKADNMKRLTAIEERISKDPSAVLSRDDLRLIYEIDHECEGFGSERDPRIDSLLKGRDIYKDVVRMFDCSLSEVAFKSSEVTPNTRVVWTNLDLHDYTQQVKKRLQEFGYASTGDQELFYRDTLLSGFAHIKGRIYGFGRYRLVDEREDLWAWEPTFPPHTLGKGTAQKMVELDVAIYLDEAPPAYYPRESRKSSERFYSKGFADYERFVRSFDAEGQEIILRKIIDYEERRPIDHEYYSTRSHQLRDTLGSKGQYFDAIDARAIIQETIKKHEKLYLASLKTA